MNNLTYFWVWLLLSVCIITGFWHIAIGILLFIVFSFVLIVKKNMTMSRLLCLWVWWTLWLLSIFYSLQSTSHEIFFQHWQPLLVQVDRQLKPDMMSAYIVEWSTTSSRTLLIQGDSFTYPPWAYVQVIPEDIIFSAYPTINFTNIVTWYPWNFEYTYRLAMKWYEWYVRANTHGIYPSYRSLSSTSLHRTTIISSFVNTHIQKSYSRTSAWLLQWMILWGRENLTQEEYESFVGSWLVHIIAVSWSNITMVVLMLSYLLFWCPVYVRIRVTIIWIILYSLIVWLDSSVYRALVMGSVVLIAVIGWRRVSISRVLWYACIILLISNPRILLYDVWFLLSFGALIWILIFNRFIAKSSGWWFLSLYVWPSLWATLWVLPVLIVLMDWINILSPLINIVIVPFIPIVLLLWVLWVIIHYPFMQIVEYMISLIFSISNWANEYGFILEVSTALSKVLFICILLLSYRIASIIFLTTMEPLRT